MDAGTRMELNLRQVLSLLALLVLVQKALVFTSTSKKSTSTESILSTWHGTQSVPAACCGCRYSVYLHCWYVCTYAYW